MLTMAYDNELETAPASFPFSKRAARRMIQRAFVLVGRDRNVRQHLREIRLETLWVLEDWNFAWSITLDRGKIRFDRRPAKRPGLTLTWPAAEEFFHGIEAGRLGAPAIEPAGGQDLRRIFDLLCRSFAQALFAVLKNPFDEAGNRLV